MTPIKDKLMRLIKLHSKYDIEPNSKLNEEVLYSHGLPDILIDSNYEYIDPLEVTLYRKLKRLIRGLAA